LSGGSPHSLVVGPAFLRGLRGCSRDERRAIGRLLSSIQRDPSVDGKDKILLVPDAPLTTFVSPTFYIFYFVTGSTVFAVDLERI
jgi:hypothetical protein